MTKKDFQRISQRFSSLAESCFHHLEKEFFITFKGSCFISPKPDNCRFYFGRRKKYGFIYSKAIFDIVPALQQHAQNAISFASGRGGNALGNFFLDHPHHFRNAVPVFQHFKKYLAGNVVREIADNRHIIGKQLLQIAFQKIGFQ